MSIFELALRSEQKIKSSKNIMKLGVLREKMHAIIDNRVMQEALSWMAMSNYTISEKNYAKISGSSKIKMLV